jgi:hypothetical protein
VKLRQGVGIRARLHAWADLIDSWQIIHVRVPPHESHDILFEGSFQRDEGILEHKLRVVETRYGKRKLMVRPMEPNGDYAKA